MGLKTYLTPHEAAHVVGRAMYDDWVKDDPRMKEAVNQLRRAIPWIYHVFVRHYPGEDWARLEPMEMCHEYFRIGRNMCYVRGKFHMYLMIHHRSLLRVLKT